MSTQTVMRLPILLRNIATIIAIIFTVLIAARSGLACDCLTLSPPESEASGRHAFDVLNSVSPAPAGRLDRLTSLMESIIAANIKGDFEPLSSAYGGRIPTERLKARWDEVIRGIEESNGRVLRHEVLGSARTSERDETVVRFHCERGDVDRTWVWDLKVEGHLLGMSGRGLTVKHRLFPTGQKDFFTWDGGVRTPKTVRIDAGPDRQSVLVIGGESARRLK